MTSSSATTKQHTSAVLDRAIGLALQADSAAAAEALERLPSSDLDSESAAFRQGMMDRFGTQAAASHDISVKDSWVTELVNAYVTYWHQVLTKRQTLEAAEVELQAMLRALLNRPSGNDDSFHKLEPEIQAELTQRGFHSLMGRTLPLLELMLWRKQTVSKIEVALPERAHRITVTYLDDFVLRGWGHYATCGHRSTGGWATKSGLFAVVPAYKRLDDEIFTVRFLAHEAQHSLDMQTFGEMESWELEYRAKLTELALADTVQQDTLRRIAENRNGSSKALPHAYANFAVIQQLEQRLSGQPDHVDLGAGIVGNQAAVREAAKNLLIEDSQSRSGAGST